MSSRPFKDIVLAGDAIAADCTREGVCGLKVEIVIITNTLLALLIEPHGQRNIYERREKIRYKERE